MSGSPGGSDSSLRGKDPMQYSDDEDEGKEGYKVGGYHAVKVSKISQRRSCLEGKQATGQSRSSSCATSRLVNQISLWVR